MLDRLKLIFHHGGKFETDPGENFIYTSDLYDEWVGVDEDYLDVFAVAGYYREMGYDKAEACWFLDPEDGLEFGLRRLQVNQDLVSMIKHYHENNNVIHIYFEHGPLIPDIIDVMELFGKDHAIGQKVGMEGMEEDRVEVCSQPTPSTNNAQSKKPSVSKKQSKPINFKFNTSTKIPRRYITRSQGLRKQASKEPVHLNVDSSSDSYESAEDSLYKPHMPLDSVDSSSDNNDDVGPTSNRRKRKPGNDNDKSKKKAIRDEDICCFPSIDASDYEKEVDDDEKEENLQCMLSIFFWL
ncbi:hypothetical protein Ahy_A01g003543 [Arachis hypogaea]|uniref:PB1-like domain-containing protein n=1 Tax=Arachis hypogaea TaxID=3818 RepID=A0A445ETF9_ARAHY|nr:hypothetical protein Ahy_A01g003543 [Arachis hypogaea]